MRIKSLIARQMPFFVGSIALLWQVLFFYVPLVFIGMLSVLQFSSTGAWTGFTLAHYAPFIKTTYGIILAKSLALALANVAICFCVGFPVAYFLSFKAKGFKNFFFFLLILPFWTNFLLHVYAWFFVLERNGFLNTFLQKVGLIGAPFHFLNSLGAILLVMVYCYLPFMVLPIYSILEKVDRKIVEASYDLGATTWQTWIRVILPLAFSGVRSGFFLVFVPSFGEFAIPGLMGGEKQMFAGSVIAHYILGNQTLASGAAFTVVSCVVLIVFILVAAALVRKFFKIV
ncbi:ABC transporter permease [Candidatus Dependentiae bacterium]|nr:ABC transporter permease [Candidatus Dependentiae bacterium]